MQNTHAQTDTPVFHTQDTHTHTQHERETHAHTVPMTLLNLQEKHGLRQQRHEGPVETVKQYGTWLSFLVSKDLGSVYMG
eukprot:m.113372 g.113372  ORF g.113372 m.113372 type:complete len:80 (+) comp13511_c1_seq7:1110-1349(+)